jgi:hypothetical protein
MDIDSMFYEAQKKIEWLVDGYFINCLLPGTKGKFYIPTEWIVKHYNVEMEYFRPKNFKPQIHER